MSPTSYFLAILLALCTILAPALSALSTITLSISPVSDSVDKKPTPLAQITFDPARLNATLKSYNLPKRSPAYPSTQLLRLGTWEPEFRGILTSAAAALDPRFSKTFVLHADEQTGTIFHFGLETGLLPAAPEDAKADGSEGISVRVEPRRAGAAPVLNRPVVLNKDGKAVTEGQKEEKTFLQKYWWAIVIFLAVQMVAGGKE